MAESLFASPGNGAGNSTEESGATAVSTWSQHGLVCASLDIVHQERHRNLIQEAAKVILAEDAIESSSLVALSLIELEQGWNLLEARSALYKILKDSDSSTTLGERAWKIAAKMKDPETLAQIVEIGLFSDQGQSQNAIVLIKEQHTELATFIEQIIGEFYDESDITSRDKEEGDEVEDGGEEVEAPKTFVKLSSEVDHSLLASIARRVAFEPSSSEADRELAIIALEKLEVVLSAEEERFIVEIAKNDQSESAEEEPQDEIEDTEDTDESEGDDEVIPTRARALRVLAKSRSEVSLDALARVALFDDQYRARIMALEALAKREDPFSREVLVTALLDEDSDVQSKVKELISTVGSLGQEAKYRLYSILAYDNESARTAAIEAITGKQTGRFPDELLTALKQGPKEVRFIVAEYIDTLEEIPVDIKPDLQALARSSIAEDRLVFLQAVENFNDEDMEKVVKSMALSDIDKEVKLRALYSALDSSKIDDTIRAIFRSSEDEELKIVGEHLSGMDGDSGLRMLCSTIPTVFDRARKQKIIQTVISEFEEYLDDNVGLAKDLINLGKAAESGISLGAKAVREILVANGYKEAFQQADDDLARASVGEEAAVLFEPRSDNRDDRGIGGVFRKIFG